METNAGKQAVWPSFMAGLEPDAPESSVVAAVPEDIAVVEPPHDLPASVSAWSGDWSGWAGQGRSYHVRLVVERLSTDRALVVCARAADAQPLFFERMQAQIQGTELQCDLEDGANIRFRMRNPSVVELLWRERAGRWIAGVMSRGNTGTGRVVERVPMDILEDGERITLEMVTFKPDGPGPYPTLVFNHGSTGMGNDPSLFTSTVTSPVVAHFFNERGWMVVFPQRRGRGKSGGRYDEGFEPDRSQYSDDPRFALAGAEHALEDLDCVTKHLLARTDVDAGRLLIGGHSRGGFLSLAHAGTRPGLFCGVLNFVGGWVDEHGDAAEIINTDIACRGASFRGATLWLYAENDPFYSIAHSRKNFRAFEAAGGRGQFHVLATAPGQDGHHILSLMDIWGPAVDDLLARIGAQDRGGGASVKTVLTGAFSS